MPGAGDDPCRSLQDLCAYDPQAYPGLLGLQERDRLCRRILLGLERHQAVEEVIAKSRALIPIEEQRSQQHIARFSRVPTSSGAPGVVRRGTLEEPEVPAVQEVRAWRKSIAERQIQEVLDLYAKYDQLTAKEYSTIDEKLKPEFAGLAAKRGLTPERYYQWLRQFYVGAGISCPPKELKEINATVTFLGRSLTGGAHRDLERVLKRAEQELVDMGLARGTDVRKQVSDSIRKKETIGGFVPRPQNDEDSLSLHALGRAIDIDSTWNQHLLGQKQIALDKVLAWLHLPETERVSRVVKVGKMSITPENEAEEAYIRMQNISEAVKSFLNNWIPSWEEARTSSVVLDERTKEAHTLLEELLFAFGAISRTKTGQIEIKEPMKIVKEIARVGLITIPLDLFTAVKKAGAHLGIAVRLGIEYHTTKDSMHIEVPLPSKKEKKR
jgi:hypothetical protein